MKRQRSKSSAGINVTSSRNISLHSAYLSFAIRAGAARSRSSRRFGIPVSRSIVEAIRYSYDFIDAASEFAFQLLAGGLGPDRRPETWLTRYIDREWKRLSVSDRLGFVGLMRDSNQGFWVTEKERCLFEELKHVRNALTHPGLFGKTTEAEYPDLDSEATSSVTTVRGKMKRSAESCAHFAQHPEDLRIEDARKAVEIALRHSERLEQLFGVKNDVLFGPTNPRTGEKRAARAALSRMKSRYFDAIWDRTAIDSLMRERAARIRANSKRERRGTIR